MHISATDSLVSLFLFVAVVTMLVAVELRIPASVKTPVVVVRMFVVVVRMFVVVEPRTPNESVADPPRSHHLGGFVFPLCW